MSVMPRPKKIRRRLRYMPGSPKENKQHVLSLDKEQRNKTYTNSAKTSSNKLMKRVELHKHPNHPRAPAPYYPNGRTIYTITLGN